MQAARIPARHLLRKLWVDSGATNEREFLHRAPQLATQHFGLNVIQVPGILGDNKIAGILDRPKKQILIATAFSYTSQRFTLAHELGHFVLHPGTTYFRDRELSAPGGPDREYYELEVDSFAAEFLMPRVYLLEAFTEMFGGPLDGRAPDIELARAVSAGKKVANSWTPGAFADASPIQRACAVATCYMYRGRFFESLTRQFQVSTKAMGIQLLQLGLVK